MLLSMLSRRLQQLGAKVVTCSDSTGWIYDPEGIDVALLKEVKEVKRARLTEYAAAETKSLSTMRGSRRYLDN